MSKAQASQRGGFVLGLIVGLLLGLGLALGVALYVTKVPIPFVNKVPQRTAEQDAEEAARNRNWDPNAALGGRASAKAASGVVGGNSPEPGATPSPTATPAPQVPAPAPAPTAAAKPASAATASATPAVKAAASAPAAAAATGGDPYVYFVQAGAYTRSEDAEGQRAKLAMQGFSAKIYEREQSGRTVYRVRLGPLDSRDEAEGLQRKVEAGGMEANLVRVQR